MLDKRAFSTYNNICDFMSIVNRGLKGKPVKLNLLHLKPGHSGEERSLDFEHSLDLSGRKLWGGFPFKSPVSLKGSVSVRLGVYTISYEADYVFCAECSRCLAPISQSERREFSHSVLVDAANDEQDAHISAPRGELDLDELACADILLSYGSVPLCREDCAGLCPKCGKNKNDGPCGCVLNEPAPRFAVLRRLIDEN